MKTLFRPINRSNHAPIGGIAITTLKRGKISHGMAHRIINPGYSKMILRGFLADQKYLFPTLRAIKNEGIAKTFRVVDENLTIRGLSSKKNLFLSFLLGPAQTLIAGYIILYSSGGPEEMPLNLLLSAGKWYVGGRLASSLKTLLQHYTYLF